MSLVKEFCKSHRIGSSVGKTLLWIWVKNDLPKMTGDLGVDLAGGSMLNKRFFSTKKYISVDIDQKKLDAGISSNPDATAINTRIQDFLKENKGFAPDVLVCVQTMGTNRFFKHDETIDVVSAMYESLRVGGGMIFNIGSNNVDLEKIEKKLSDLFLGRFGSVVIKHYGAFHQTKPQRLPSLVRLALAYCMHLAPPLRTLFGFKIKKIYFCCNNKLKMDHGYVEGKCEQ